MAIAQIEQAQNCARISASLSAAGGAVAVTGAPMVATTAGAAEALRSSAERVDSVSGVEQRLDGLGAAIGGGSPRAVPIAAIRYSISLLVAKMPNICPASGRRAMTSSHFFRLQLARTMRVADTTDGRISRRRNVH